MSVVGLRLIRAAQETLEIVRSGRVPGAAADAPEMNGGAPQHTPKVTHMDDTTVASKAQQSLGFIAEGTTSMNPAQAGWIVQNLRYENQRDESRAKRHIADLREMMQRGLWRQKDQIDFARLPDGQVILVNGHHRLRAQSESGQNILWNVVIHDCADMAAVGALYYTFDTVVRKRSVHNILNGVNLAGDLDLAKQTTAALFRSVPIIIAGMKVGSGLVEAARLIDDRLNAARQYADAARVLQGAFAPAPFNIKKRLFGGGVFAVALVTAKADPDRAYRFWRGIAENDGLKKADPRATLLKWMTFNESRSGLLSAPMIASALAWNAYIEGRNLGHIRVSGTAGVRIACTDLRVQP